MKQTIQGILSIITRDEKVNLCLLIAADLLIGLLDIVFLGALLLVIGFYTKGIGGSYQQYIPQELADKNSVGLIGLFLLLFAIKNTFGFIATRWQHHFFYNVASRLSLRNMREYFNGPYQDFTTINSAVYTRRISQQPVEFSHYILTNVQQIISQLILIVFAVAAILLYHPALFVVLLILLMPPVAALGWLIKRRSAGIRTKTKHSAEQTIQHLNQALDGYIESNVFHKKDFFAHRYHRYQQQLNQNLASQQSIQSLPARLVEVFAVAGFFILVLISKWQSTAVDALNIGIFMAAAYKIIPGIVKIMNSQAQIRAYSFTLNDLQPAPQPSIEPANIAVPIHSIAFKNVSFCYEGRPVLNNLSFNLNSGQLAGISAPSGQGKTTLINLLLGFLDPCWGDICINGKNLPAAGRQAMWPVISYVKQQPYFIDDTIERNITLEDVTLNPGRLQRAIALCQLNTLISKLPDGIGFIIHENGRNLSGGQRQRIMLARALYRDFDLLILDEPFSELDEPSGTAILKNLRALTNEGKMILFISHQQSNLNYCHQIINLNER